MAKIKAHKPTAISQLTPSGENLGERHRLQNLMCAVKNQPATSGILLWLLLELVLCTLQTARLIAQETTSRAAWTFLRSPVFDNRFPATALVLALPPVKQFSFPNWNRNE